MVFDMMLKVMHSFGQETPEDKIVRMCLDMVLLGTELDVIKRRRRVSPEKREDYRKLACDILTSDKQLASNGLTYVPRDDANSLLHKLYHAADGGVPLGRQHLHHLRKCLRSTHTIAGASVVFISTEAMIELEWWNQLLQLGELDRGLPLASRYDFPAASTPTCLVQYGDASRELPTISKPAKSKSGFGSWSIVDGVFYFVHGLWTVAELERYSINVLEAHTMNIALAIVDYLRARGHVHTHLLSFSDNTSAEHTFERNRPKSDGLAACLLYRKENLDMLGIYEAVQRVTSADNEIADHLSRGRYDIVQAWCKAANLQMVEVDASARRAIRQ